MSPRFEEREWAQAGKVLLVLSGLACLGLALYQSDDSVRYALRVWVGGFGCFAIFVALADARPTR